MSDDLAAAMISGQTWRDFCRLLEQAGDRVLERGLDDPLEIAEGYRMLTRLLRGSLEGRLEWGSPSHPHLICTCHETIKIVAENPDNLYLGSAINGGHEYRVWGTRGDARWISFNTFAAGGFGSSGGRGTGTTLHESEIEFGPDGEFEIVLSQDERPGNWLRLEPDTSSLTIRQTFADKRTDEAGELHIERTDGDPGPPPPLDPAFLARSLLGSAHYVSAITDIGADWADRQSKVVNRFHNSQLDDTKAFKDPQITYHQAWVELDDDQALIVELEPPDCDYWMIGLHNYWMETLDYRYHQCHLNNSTATISADGSATCVVARRNPGVSNWLDLAGHRRGLIGVRWVGDNVDDRVPQTRVVPLDSVAQQAR